MSGTTETFCGLCGNRIVLTEGVWYAPDDPETDTADLCLMNEPEQDLHGPHQPSMSPASAPSDGEST